MRTHKIFQNNAGDFSKLVKDKGSLLFVYHPSCGHCERMKPDWENLEKTASTLPDTYQLITIHADAVPHIKKRFSVNGFPTLLTLHKGGKVHNPYHGDRSYKDLLRFLKKHLKKVNVFTKKKRHRRTGKRSFRARRTRR